METDLHQRYPDLTVIGVAGGGFGDRQETILDFVEQTGVTFPIVWDESTLNGWDFPENISPYPRQVLLDAEGRATYIASEHQAGALDRAVRDLLGLD